MVTDKVWKLTAIANRFVSYGAAIPMAQEQIGVRMTILKSTHTFEEIAQEYKNRPDKAANILAPVELQCDWLREIGYEEVDCYFRIYELAVFAGRRPNPQSKV
jgi:hypothetical protein